MDIVFRLEVFDGELYSDPDDEVTVHIQNINDPPSCEFARACPERLWPPNHKLVKVAITGVTDPDDDYVVITVTDVTQDEPINGLGDGDTSPDAVILDNGCVLLRAERSGTGNGRVYEISFTAEDEFGTVCSGSVKVYVPHSRKDKVVVDDGQAFSSLQP